MKKELTEEQVAQLFVFTTKHYVEYYDVQVELVDHLASSIEIEMEKNLELDFDAALNNVFNSFGIFGFADVVESSAKSVWKHQRKLWKQTFIKQFKWPNLLRSMFIWIILFISLSIFPVKIVAIITALLIIPLSLYFLIIEQQYLKKYNTKKLVLTSQRFIYLSLSYIPWYLLQFFGSFIYKQELWLISSLLTFLFILVFAYRACSKEIINQAETQYPEAFKTAQD